MRRILYLSGTRADYGLMRSTLRAIETHSELELGVIVTGLHLAEEMGNTGELIVADGFRIADTIPATPESDNRASMVQAIAGIMNRVTETIERENPDLLVLLGDRGESLAAACAAAFMDVTVVHMHCGDVSEGHIDNLTRFAISQYAHVLMPATPQSRSRLSGCGVPDDRIFVVGAPGLDDIVAGTFTDGLSIRSRLGLDDRDIIVVLYHPASAELADAASHIRSVLAAVSMVDGCQVVVLGNNLDAGGREMLNEIHANPASFSFWPNLERDDYIGLLSEAAVLVGNSSSGIIESTSLRLPVVNVGSRQAGRECAENVLHVSPDETQVRAAIDRALHDTAFRDQCQHAVSPYGDGKTGARVAETLAALELSPECRVKRYTAA